MSIFNGNASPFTESNSLYERNSISGLGNLGEEEKKWYEKFDLKEILGGAFGGGKKEEEVESGSIWDKFTTKKKKKEDTPWYQTLLETGLNIYGEYNKGEANKEQEKYNREKLRILEESYSSSVRVDASDAKPYLDTGKGFNTRPAVQFTPGPGWSSRGDQDANQLALERERNRERQEERDRRADEESKNTKTILYVAGGGVALIAVLLVAMKVMK